jgi:hypothetical protein
MLDGSLNVYIYDPFKIYDNCLLLIIKLLYRMSIILVKLKKYETFQKLDLLSLSGVKREVLLLSWTY